MFWISQEFGQVDAVLITKKKPVKKTTKKAAPKTARAGAGAGLSTVKLPNGQTVRLGAGAGAVLGGASRLVVLEARATLGAWMNNLNTTRTELLKEFQADGWDIASLQVVSTSAASYEVKITIQANVPEWIAAETARENAISLLQNFKRSWIVAYQVFTDVDVRIISDFKSTKSVRDSVSTSANYSPASSALSDSITTGGGFLDNFGLGLGLGGGAATPVTIAALVVLGVLILKR